MKRIAIFSFWFSVSILLNSKTFSQKFIDAYYKYNWEGTPIADDASFFSHAVNTDSGWYRQDFFLQSGKRNLQMIGLYEDKENKISNGVFRWYYPQGELKRFGKYKHGNKDGLWLEWFSNGLLKDSLSYTNGKYSGISMSWYKNGYSKDSLNIDDDGNGTYVAWFDNGLPSEAGKYKDFKKFGKWIYYHKNGKPSSVELYDDTLKSFQYYNENGLPQNDTALIIKEPAFPGGNKGWNNYITKNLHFPERVSILNSDHIVVVVEATIDETGKIIDAEVIVPFHPVFDKEALRAITQSPKWIPAESHNRKINSVIPFSVQFGQGFY